MVGWPSDRIEGDRWSQIVVRIVHDGSLALDPPVLVIDIRDIFDGI
jgi:hypothetical protein